VGTRGFKTQAQRYYCRLRDLRPTFESLGVNVRCLAQSGSSDSAISLPRAQWSSEVDDCYGMLNELGMFHHLFALLIAHEVLQAFCIS